MKNFQLATIILLLALPISQLFGYSLGVEGYIIDQNGQFVDNHEVQVKVKTTDPNVGYDLVIRTNRDGYFAEKFDVPSGVSGEVHITMASCRGDISQSFRFAEDAPHILSRFSICTNNARCTVKIGKELSGNTLVLYAEASGTAPFKYEWSTGESTQRIKATDDGEYCVKVTDASGCETKACERIISRDSCAVEIIVRKANSGIYLHAQAKGTAPFTYEWSTGDSTATIMVEKPGEYCVKITDANGCESKTCFDYLNDRCGVTIVATRTANGVILEAQAKGTAPFKFKWSNGETTQRILVEKEGQYCVYIVDANGCEARACYTVGNVDECDVRIRQITGRNTVYLWAIARGAKPFKYEWSTGETTPRIQVKASGEYCVKITDANGCESKACFRFNDNDGCRVAIIVRKISRDSQTVLLEAVTKGNGPFKYEWSTGETTETITVKNKGQYCVTIYSANGCRDRVCIDLPTDRRITPSRSLDTQNGIRDRVINLYPNPAEDVIHVTVTNVDWTTARYQIINALGRVVKQGQLASHDVQRIPVADLQSERYVLMVYGNQQTHQIGFYKN